MSKEYLFSKEWGAWIEESKPIKHKECFDGVSIHGGSLLGSGFQPNCKGITLPEEIDGIPVTELCGTYEDEEIGYIESHSLKRIAICIIPSVFPFFKNTNSEMRCSIPFICGGAQSTLESVKLMFRASKMELGSFRDCEVLTSIIFEGNVVDSDDWDCSHFDSGIFSGCKNLQIISGCLSGYMLGGHTFDGCSSLTHAPDIRVEVLGDCEFRNCTSLSSIHLHNGLKSIGSSVFENCSSFKDLYIPDTVTYLGIGVFKNCVQLETVHLPSSISEINSEMFFGCSKIGKVFLSDDITKIGEKAFMGCESLKSPWIPKNLISIGEKAFYGSKSINTIMIPESVQEIGKDAFGDCSGITIKCFKGSFAECYAKENMIKYVLM